MNVKLNKSITLNQSSKTEKVTTIRAEQTVSKPVHCAEKKI